MRLFFIGDSLTLGYLDPTLRGWAGRLTERLMKSGQLAPETTVYNLGIRGNSAVKMVERWQSEVAVRSADEARLFLFCFGTADSTQHFPPEQSLAAARAMLTAAQSMGTALFLTPPPVIAADVTKRIETLSASLKQLCSELKVPCFDLFTQLVKNEPYQRALIRSDNIHPDPAGYDLMADIILGWEELSSAVAQ